MENKDPSTLQSDWMISSYTNLNTCIYTYTLDNDNVIYLYTHINEH